MCVVDPMHNLLLGTVDWATIVNMLRPGAARSSLTMPTKFSYHTTITATACQQSGCHVG